MYDVYVGETKIGVAQNRQENIYIGFSPIMALEDYFCEAVIVDDNRFMMLDRISIVMFEVNPGDYIAWVAEEHLKNSS